MTENKETVDITPTLEGVRMIDMLIREAIAQKEKIIAEIENLQSHIDMVGPLCLNDTPLLEQHSQLITDALRLKLTTEQERLEWMKKEGLAEMNRVLRDGQPPANEQK